MPGARNNFLFLVVLFLIADYSVYANGEHSDGSWPDELASVLLPFGVLVLTSFALAAVAEWQYRRDDAERQRQVRSQKARRQ
jgi:hypothetical protein